MKISSTLLTAIFIVALFILLFFAGIAYRQIQSLKDSENLVSHSYDVNIELEKLFSILKDAESGQRGFLITNDSTYLKNYYAAGTATKLSMNRLVELMHAENVRSEVLDSLFNLINHRTRVLETSMKVAGQSIDISDSLRVSMVDGRNTMEGIRRQINTMVRAQMQLMTIRENEYRNDISFAPLTYIYVILFASLIFIFSFFKISRDTTDLQYSNRKATLINAELVKQNNIFNHAEETSNIGSFYWDLQKQEIKYSPNLFRMLDSTEEHMPTALSELADFIHPEDREQALQESTALFKEGLTITSHFRVVTNLGTIKYFKATGRFIGQNPQNILVGTFQDITSSELLNQQYSNKKIELQKSEDRYHRMVNEVEDYAIILLDKNGIIQNWNKGAEKIKGYHEQEILGKPFSVFYPEEDKRRNIPEKLLQEAILHGKASHAGWRIRKDGSRFWGNIIITSLHDEHNQVTGFTKVTRDLTAQREAEEKLLKYNRHIEQKNAELQTVNEELASFNHIASHDLQEPLRKIQTFISRIASEEYDHISEKGREYFSRINTSANRMQHLIDDLITYTHTNKGDKIFEETDLNKLLATVADELKPTIDEKKATLYIHPLPTLKVIPFQLGQLFTNLIDNALKYSKPDLAPVIEINARLISSDQSTAIKKPDNRHYYEFSVTDNGIGFEKKYAESIFTLFQRLHDKSEYSGTGIGLAICKKIVENHNGFISAESAPGKGSKFHIYIPAEA